MRRLARFVSSLAVLASFSPASVLANPLFISEYIEGSSNNKAIEIFNPTGGAVNLGDYSIKIYFNGAITPLNTIPLSSVMLASGDAFVLANNLASFAGTADQTSASLTFNGDDAVELVLGTNTVDVIGQIGVDPGTEWGLGLTSTADNTLRRKSGLCAGDANGGNVFDPATEWDGFATDVFNGLGSHTSTCADTPGVPVTSPGSMAAMSLLLVAGGAILLRRRGARSV